MGACVTKAAVSPNKKNAKNAGNECRHKRRLQQDEPRRPENRAHRQRVAHRVPQHVHRDAADRGALAPATTVTKPSTRSAATACLKSVENTAYAALGPHTAYTPMTAVYATYPATVAT